MLAKKKLVGAIALLGGTGRSHGATQRCVPFHRMRCLRRVQARSSWRPNFPHIHPVIWIVNSEPNIEPQNAVEERWTADTFWLPRARLPFYRAMIFGVEAQAQPAAGSVDFCAG